MTAILRVAIAILLSIGYSRQVLSEEPNLVVSEKVRTDLVNLWKSQASEVATASVSFRYFISFQSQMVDLSWEEFNARLATLATAKFGESRGRLEALALGLTKPDLDFQPGWVNGRLVIDGEKSRE